MFDPATFVLAFLFLSIASLYARKRRRERERWHQFDGGWADQNERRVTRILSDNIINVRPRND